MVSMSVQCLEELDRIVPDMMRAAGIPGAALAVVYAGQTMFAKGYGSRNLDANLPMTSRTSYPIASTSKALNATLLGMLVDEGLLAWDAPVRTYLPHFRLADPFASAHVTVRDLIIMRTGLPRHDWVWADHLITRAQMAERIQYLSPSAGFREKFQYNSLTVTAAGHIAEIVTGQQWEEFVAARIFRPLDMDDSSCSRPPESEVMQSYHQNSLRELLPARLIAAEFTAPSGGAIYSTVEDMARWLAFNLEGGVVRGCALIKPQTLAEIHSPQVAVGSDPAAPTPHAPYAMGWFADTYQGHARLSHGGYLQHVDSEVILFPKQRVGVVACINFGAVKFARWIAEQAAGLMLGFTATETVEEKLAQYDKKIADAHTQNAAVRRVASTSPSHPLRAYVGLYVHAAYGAIEIRCDGRELTLHRSQLIVPLEHWHYDIWVAKPNDSFPIHAVHTFDRTGRLRFESNVDGEIDALFIRLDPNVPPVRFDKAETLAMSGGANV